MPEIQHFFVGQTRVVEVSANNEIDALRIADAAFSNGQNSAHGVINGPEGVWGNTHSKVKVTNISATRERF